MTTIPVRQVWYPWHQQMINMDKPGSGGSYINTNPISVAVVGDSFTNQISSQTEINNILENVGYINALNYQSRQRYIFSDALNHGVSGDTISEMVARLPDLDQPSSDIVIMLIGTNSLNAGVALASMTTDVQTGVDYVINTLGRRLVICTVPPRTDASWTTGDIVTAKANMLLLNDFIRSKADGGSVLLADYYAKWNDGNQLPLTGYTVPDGLHPSPLGAQKMGEVLYDLLTPLYGAVTGTGKFDGLLLNEGLAGTSGSLGSGATGDVATSWLTTAIGTTTDTSWRTYSKDANDNQVIELNIPAGNAANEGVYFEQVILDTAVPSFKKNKRYLLEVDMDVQVHTGNLDTISINVREEHPVLSNIRWLGGDDSNGNPSGILGEGVLITPIGQIQNDSTKLRLRLEIAGDTTTEALTATIVVKSIRFVHVS